MKKVLSFVIFSLLTANSVFADVYCNDNGYCTGTIDGKSVNTPFVENSTRSILSVNTVTRTLLQTIIFSSQALPLVFANNCLLSSDIYSTPIHISS